MIERMLDKKLSVLATKERISALYDKTYENAQNVKSIKDDFKAASILHNKEIKLKDTGRRNKIIFSGIKCSNVCNFSSVIENFCENVLGVKNVFF